MNQLPRNRPVWFFSLAVFGLLLDLISKEWVFRDLGYPGKASHWTFESLNGWLTFRFLTSINEGALWGIGQGYTWLFALLSIVAAGGVLIWLFKYKAARSLWLTIALALILAGTLGNLYDRIGLHGCVRADGSVVYGVRDFLLFTFGAFHWPIFNFADCFLVIGAVMLGLQSLKADVPAEQDATETQRSGQPAQDENAAKSSVGSVASQF